MLALGERDVETLVRLSSAPGETPDQLRKEWRYATEIAGKRYRFAFRILMAKEANDNTASVALHVFRNADLDTTYPEKFELPMLKVDGNWLVEIRGINRQMYPALPR